MPYSGRIVRAYRHRRIVKRRQKIGPYVVDFRRCLLQAVNHITDMLLVKLRKSLFDGINRKDLTADTDGGGETP